MFWSCSLESSSKTVEEQQQNEQHGDGSVARLVLLGVLWTTNDRHTRCRRRVGR
jgi:hypothetical protein